MALLPVADALAQLLEGAGPLGPETIALGDAAGRVLSADIPALRTQPPFHASAMDGYAVRAGDAGKQAVLTVIGEVAAGQTAAVTVEPGTAMRIFTGAPVPSGADAILIQENARTHADGTITITEPVSPGNAIRPAGLDFAEGQGLLAAGTRLTPAALGLAAAGGHASLPVWRKPRVAVLSTGDELVAPGQTPGPGQIVSSNSIALAALLSRAGADVSDLGIARDTPEALEEALDRALALAPDLLVTIGGASVGDHDLVRPVLTGRGMDLAFWKIAMRPGKPMMAGRFGAMRVLGLPGNPVSSFVTATVFAVPLVEALAGRTGDDRMIKASLAHELPGNGDRTHYMRACRTIGTDGAVTVSVFENQDSSLLSFLAAADCLVVRPAHAPAAPAGEEVPILPLS